MLSTKRFHRFVAISAIFLFALSLILTGLNVAYAQDPITSTSVFTSPVPIPTPGETVPVPDGLPTPFALLVLGLIGGLFALFQERVGESWTKLPVEWKHVITALTTAGLPFVLNLLTPIWRPELGDVTVFAQTVMTYVVGPLFAYFVGQIVHILDR